MAAPPTTARSTPAGLFLEDGHQTFIAFARLPTFSVWEKVVKSPMLDGGEAINVTTMHNATVRTFAARRLYTLGPSTMRVAYDPNAYDQARETLLNQPGGITEHTDAVIGNMRTRINELESKLADGSGENAGYTKTEVGAVVFDTVGALDTMFAAGHATNVSKLL